MSNILPHLALETASDPSASVIWLHGLGADGHDFVDVVPTIPLPKTLGIRFIFPHAPERAITINNHMVMRAWYDIFSLTDLQREDMTGLKQSEQHIQALIEQEIARGIPSERIILAGFSQGAALALHTALRHPTPLGGIIALCGYLPDLGNFTQEIHPSNRHLPIFMAQGQYDAIIPLELAKASEMALSNAGFGVTWRTYPMEHTLCQEEIADIGDWLSERLGG